MLFADCYVEIPGRLFTQLESPFDFPLTCIFFIPFLHNVKPLLFQLNPAGWIMEHTLSGVYFCVYFHFFYLEGKSQAGELSIWEIQPGLSYTLSVRHLWDQVNRWKPVNQRDSLVESGVFHTVSTEIVKKGFIDWKCSIFKLLWSWCLHWFVIHQ